MVIDSHQHFWQLDQPFEFGWLYEEQHRPICRDYLPQHLLPQLQAAGVERSVFVQTQHTVEENRWALRLAEEHGFIAGVVGWVDLSAENVEDQLSEFLESPKFVGVRHITQGEPDENFIVRPDIVRGLKVLQKHGVPFDLLFYTQHLRHAATLAQMLPELPMVIDHLSKPKIREQQLDSWKADLRRAAEFPNLYCKLSGMVTEADWKHWKPADLKPYVEIALDAFGPERCLYGSDWPVCELAASYAEVHGVLQQLLGALSDSERAQIFGQTAARFYSLPGLT